MNQTRRLCLLLPGNSIQETRYVAARDETELYLKWEGWIPCDEHGAHDPTHTLLPEGGSLVKTRLTGLLQECATLRKQKECEHTYDQGPAGTLICPKCLDLQEVPDVEPDVLDQNETKYRKHYDAGCACQSMYHERDCWVVTREDAPTNDATVKRYAPNVVTSGDLYTDKSHAMVHQGAMIVEDAGKWLSRDEVAAVLRERLELFARHLKLGANDQDLRGAPTNNYECVKQIMQLLGIKEEE